MIRVTTCERCRSIELPGLVLDHEAREVRFDGRAVRLQPQLFDLFDMLVRAEGRLVRHGQIIAAFYGADPRGGPDDAMSLIRVRVAHLRAAVRAAGIPVVIENIERAGYRLQINGRAA